MITDREFFDLYVVQCLPMEEIAKRAEQSLPAASRRRKQIGIPIRNATNTTYTTPWALRDHQDHTTFRRNENAVTNPAWCNKAENALIMSGRDFTQWAKIAKKWNLTHIQVQQRFHALCIPIKTEIE